MSDKSNLTTEQTIIPGSIGGTKDDVMDPSLRLILLILILIVSFKGMVTNVINVVVFFKLRKNDPINISLFGLAVSDFLICLTTLGFFTGTSVWLIEILFNKFRIQPIHVIYLAIGVPHSECVRITLLLTAFIASQRCICVVFPLHVKRLITHRRVIVAVVICYILGLTDIIQVGLMNRLRWIYHPFLNTTILSHVMMDNFFSVGVILAPIKLTIFLLIPFAAVAVSTGVLVSNLKRVIVFRQAAVLSSAPVAVDQPKEIKISKMVIIICILYIICYIPNIAFVILVSFTPDTNLQYSQRPNLQLIFYSGFLMDTINSSVNIWIYYFNSSNYKNVFKKTFCMKSDE